MSEWVYERVGECHSSIRHFSIGIVSAYSCGLVQATCELVQAMCGLVHGIYMCGLVQAMCELVHVMCG